MKRLYPVIYLVLVLQFFALTTYGQISTTGKEFWVGFMDNNRILPGAPDRAILQIVAVEDAAFTIEYLGQIRSESLVKGERFTLTVDSQGTDLHHRFSGTVENKGVYISSSGKLAVYAFNERIRSADGTVVLPVGALGKDYLITSHFEKLTHPVTYDGNVDNESSLLVIATEDDTQIEITKSNGAPPFSIRLNRGQSYQIKERYDLTGSRVRVIGDDANSCKKIAVFGGNKWSSVGDCGGANDNLFQQAYPVTTWGKSFIHVALEGRTSGELVKVLASEDNTEVFVNGASRGTINSTKFLTFNFNVNQTVSITTSKPSSVTVFSKSQECNQIGDPKFEQGDPFMISYSPNEQLLKEVDFLALWLTSIEVNYVNIIVPAGAQSNTVLDGENIGSLFTQVPGNPAFYYARLSISKGVHRLTNPEGFIAYVYGFGFLESYGYVVGAALDNLNFEIKSEYDFEVDGDRIACLDHEGTWSITPESDAFTYFTWDFGDGSVLQEGKEVKHTFEKPGIYEITVTASLSANTCDQQEDETFQVEVLESKAEIIGEKSVCPDVEELIYKLGALQHIKSVIFEVEGGTIVQDYGDSVLVKWGAANPNAKIIAKLLSTNGCLVEPLVLDVVINQILDAGDPIGNLDVCFDPLTTHFYSVPNVSYVRGYEWEVTDGLIISGKDQPTVEISWNSPNVTGTVSYKTYSLVDQSCEGTSSALEVNVSDEFLVSVKHLGHDKCFGENTGKIDLDIKGGVGPLKFIWSHDSGLNSATAEGLPVGTYSVTVIDQLGCERVIENLQITEPSRLALTSMSVAGVSCFGKNDGVLNLGITGGSPPYRIEIDGEKVFSSQLNLYEVPQGNYDVIVVDQNGCSIPLSFEITSPVALEVDVRLVKPACPGGSNGELFAFPGGGKAPYVYYWESENVNSNTIIGLAKGAYTISVLDASGCVSLGTGLVTETAPDVRMPTGYNPLRDGGVFQGVSNCELNFSLWVFNRWGQLIYNGTEGWDGLVNGGEAPQGTYTFLMQYSFPLEGEMQTVDKRGNFVMIR
ncbi:SprB-like repeat protein [Algoriphagus ratkowskyi]|uniref:PKD domain-containing protein n=1 Tax=Algoriphagus ratkowskyi TaxID=57028 RepID=A0A2W7R0F3_9BACT|nr:PKD domain-containing protein [Algoriphagus ratkowskyi]PZX52746.1 SprB-like repeat protein [Algoriphagus ratkowskyi]TXD76306.1 PKD domain-containing protein [Algoriphagus ratkowskyi]